MDPNSNTNPNPAPAAPEPKPAAAPEPETKSEPKPATAPKSETKSVVPPAAKPAATKKPLPKKFILIGAIALVAILAIILGIIFIPKLFKSDEAKLAEEIFSEDLLIAVKQDDKYGYINLNGKMIIDPQFASASDFVGDKAIVEIEEGDDERSAIIDRKGNVLLKATTSERISYDPENEIWLIDEQLYGKKLKKITQDGKIVHDEDEGYYYVTSEDPYNTTDREIYNKKGESVYKFNSDSTSWDITEYGDELEQTYAILDLGDDNHSIINLDSGKVVAENIKSHNAWADDYTDFCLYDGDDCTKYLLVWNDKVVKEYDYRIDITHYGEGKNGYYAISDDDYTSEHDTEYLDLKSGEITSTRPSSSSEEDSSDLSEWEIANKSTIFSCSAGYGLMVDKTEVIPCEYEHIRTPDAITYEYLKSKGKNYVIGNKSEKSYLLQANNGKVVKEFDDSYVDFETISSFIYYDKDDTNIIYNIVTGKSAEIKGDYVYAEPMYVMVRTDDKVEYYNKNLKLFYTGER